jgi:hypothetical protein
MLAQTSECISLLPSIEATHKLPEEVPCNGETMHLACYIDDLERG